MGKIIDISGVRFGRLVVIDRAPNRKGLIYWNCICDCGGNAVVNSKNIRLGRTVSCGCYKKTCGVYRRIDLINKRFGRLVVVAKCDTSVFAPQQWECKCDCGKTKIATTSSLGSHKGTRSCGCLHDEAMRNTFTTHGKTKTAEHGVWLGMKGRCYNRLNRKYHRYGGRGITVCDRWLNSFENFLEDMGERPSNAYSIGRKNGNENYCPENCRWETQKQQQNNRCTNLIVEFDGKSQTVKQWSEEIGMKYTTLRNRITNCGWTIEEAFRTPVRKQ